MRSGLKAALLAFPVVCALLSGSAQAPVAGR